MTVLTTVAFFGSCKGENTNASKTTSTSTQPIINAEKRLATSSSRYDKVVIGVGSDPLSLLCWNFTEVAHYYMIPEIYESLYDLQNGEYVPVLVKNHVETDDTHWEVEIYDYIYDTEGNHITADDVVFSYKSLVSSGYAVNYGNFKDIEKIDTYKVRFTWTMPINIIGALEKVLCDTYIFSEKSWQSHDFTTDPIGTGPYKLQRFISGSSVILEAKDNYWQKDTSLVSPLHQSNVKIIEFDVITESSQHVIALENGSIEFSDSVTETSLKEFENSNRMNVYTYEGHDLTLLEMNGDSLSIASDQNFRKAVFYGLDSSALAVAGNGALLKAFGNASYSDYQPDWEREQNAFTQYDVAKAKEYLAKSSYKGEDVVILCSSGESDRNIAQTIQAYLLNVGIKIKIVSEENNIKMQDVKNPVNFDIFLAMCGNGVNMTNAWRKVMDNGDYSHGGSETFIKDPDLQRQISFVRTVSGHTIENIKALHTYILDKAYYYPVMSNYKYCIYNKNIIAELCFSNDMYIIAGSCKYYLD
jgi:ABC-type transport system substrate-binding protein